MAHQKREKQTISGYESIRLMDEWISWLSHCITIRIMKIWGHVCIKKSVIWLRVILQIYSRLRQCGMVEDTGIFWIYQVLHN